MRRKRYLSALLALCVLLTLFPVRAAEEAAERPVGPLRQIASGGGESHSDYYAAIDANSDLWMWGVNDHGQLGDGTTTARSAPVKILDNVSGVSLGYQHSAAIRSDGSLWTWGYNSDGQLGDGTTTARSTPVKILDDVSSVHLGSYHSAAIRSDGSLWTWGYNSDGELGDGTTSRRYKPIKVLDDVSSASLGAGHSAAIRSDGSLWMWGQNVHGQLGDGTTTGRSKPVKILDGISGVCLGYIYSAAIRLDGSLWTWGYNVYGQLGDGTTTDRFKPVKILDGVSSVNLGIFHSTAIHTDGSLLMWGKNYSHIPVKIADKIQLVNAGYTSGLFVLDDDSLWQYTLDGIPPSKTQIEIDYLPGVYIDTESLTLAVNEKATLTPMIYPASDRNSSLVWWSSAPDVAAVENGVVTAKGVGKADITVMATKTGDTAVCHVSVSAPLTLDKSSVTLRAGETCQLTPTVNRAPGEETGLKWDSDAPDVASVSDNGMVTAVAGGAATVSVTTLDGVYKADCVVTVPYEATGIKLDRASLTMKPGDSVTLTATVIPGEAIEKDIRWVSTVPGVATVTDGTVTALSIGVTTIMAVTVYGGFTASCTVNVAEDGAEPKPPTYTVTFDPTGGSVDPTSKTVTQGEPYGDLPAPTRDNYKFAGWFTAPDGGTEIKSDTKVNLSGAQTLYARWTPALKVPGLAELTYSFANSASGLGYPKPYRIPYERYKMIFGDTVAAKWYFMASGDWGGDCYGFTSTAAMFSQSGNGVDTSSFRDGAALPSQLQTGDKNASWGVTAREFLESMQVSQNAPLIQRDYRNNKDKLNELCAAVKAYQETGENPVIVAVFGKEGGHALLAYKLEQEKLYVYDCNYPATERYITLVTDASGGYTGWHYPINGSIEWGSAFKESWISFVPYADFHGVWANRAQKSNDKTELLTVNADVVLKNEGGVPIASVENGELVTTQPDIFPLIEIGITADGQAPKKDGVSFWIPVGIYDLERKGDSVRAQGEVVLMDAENPFKANVTHVEQSADVQTTSDRFKFVVDDESELNKVMFPADAAEGTYDVTFQSTLTGEQQDARIVGAVSTNALTFGMVDGQAVADATSMLSITAYFVNGERVGADSVSGYGIDGVTIDGGAVTVKLANAVSAPVSVVVCTYDDGARLLASAVKAVDSGASAELTLQTSGAAYLKAFLLDPTTSAPLCNPFQKKLS